MIQKKVVKFYQVLEDLHSFLYYFDIVFTKINNLTNKLTI